jgi:predicted DsbA family dithiol-disulfide isomerase
MLGMVTIGRAVARGVSAQGQALLVLFALCTAATACGDPSARAQQAHSGLSVIGDSHVPDVLAIIGDDQITFEDIRAVAGTDLDQIEIQYRRSRSQIIENALQALLRERLLEGEARERGQTVAQLLVAQAGRSLDPTELEVTTWYEENQHRTGGRPLEMIRPQIAEFLRDERSKAASLALERRLAEDRNVVIHFDPFRFDLSNDGAPFLGGRDAVVTLAVFSDFQCPYCARFAATLHLLHDEFGDALKIVYRQFPIPTLHPNAIKAAEASLCAHEQGRFWEMHDAMFAQQSRLGVSDVKSLARQLGLGQRRFETCLDTGRYTEQVQDDMAEGRVVGVTGTPALFVNGIPLPPGSQPFEVVAEAVRKELARSRD